MPCQNLCSNHPNVIVFPPVILATALSCLAACCNGSWPLGALANMSQAWRSPSAASCDLGRRFARGRGPDDADASRHQCQPAASHNCPCNRWRLRMDTQSTLYRRHGGHVRYRFHLCARLVGAAHRTRSAGSAFRRRAAARSNISNKNSVTAIENIKSALHVTASGFDRWLPVSSQDSFHARADLWES